MHVVIRDSAALQDWPSMGTRARVASPALVASWAEGVLYVHSLYGRTIAPGDRFVTAHRLLGRQVVLVHTVEEYNRGRSWRTRADRDGTMVIAEVTLEPAGERSATLSVDVDLSGPARIAAPMLRWSLRRSLRQALRRLVKNLELAAVKPTRYAHR